jgi:hypothetical protein
MSFTSCGITWSRPCRKAQALAARVRLMVARGEAPNWRNFARSAPPALSAGGEHERDDVVADRFGHVHGVDGLAGGEDLLLEMTGSTSSFGAVVAIASRILRSSSRVG